MQILRGLEEWGRTHAMEMLSRTMGVPETSARHAGELLSQRSSPKILVIGLYQKMGQFLCATPLIRSLSLAWPQGSIHFLGNPANAAAARANPHLREVWVWEKSGLLQWGKQLRALRNEHFDLVLLLTTERPSATGILLARMLAPRWVACYTVPAEEHWVQDATRLCHIHIPFSTEKNEVSKYLSFAEAFGVLCQGRQPEWVVSPQDEAMAQSFFNQAGGENKPWVGLFIGGKAERTDRLWPVSSFVQLAHALQSAGFRVVLISPPPSVSTAAHAFLPEEYLRLEEFRHEAKVEYPVFQEASLGRVAAFLKRLTLLVCPDGGILHLAAAVGTPTLGLFFATDPEVWRHDERHAVLDGRGTPASAITPEKVAAEVFRLLRASARI